MQAFRYREASAYYFESYRNKDEEDNSLKYPYDRSQYKNMLYRTNKSLKEIAKMVGLSIPLTLYVARHSWASIAKGKNIPISVISEGMGHDSEMTTQIYLASLDNAVVDRANAQILKEL